MKCYKHRRTSVVQILSYMRISESTETERMASRWRGGDREPGSWYFMGIEFQVRNIRGYGDG